MTVWVDVVGMIRSVRMAAAGWWALIWTAVPFQT
jgi:hypothetical protein